MKRRRLYINFECLNFRHSATITARILYAILFFLSLYPLPAIATHRCSEIISEIRVESLDNEFTRIREQYNSKIDPQKSIYYAKVHELLNRLFYPLINKIYEYSQRLDEGSIKDLYNKAVSEKSLQTGDYKNDISHFKSQLDTQTQLTIIGNVQHANRFYSFSNIVERTQDRFFWIKPAEKEVQDFGKVYDQIGLIITPLSQYGDVFSRSLLRTTQIMIEISKAELKEVSQVTYKKNKTLLQTESIRTMESNRESSNIELTPLLTTIEGIITYHQFLTNTLAKKISGIENGKEALERITFNSSSPQGLITEFTKRLSMGLVGPMNFAGRHFRKSFQLEHGGKLGFSDNLITVLKHFRMIAKRERGTRICPMASFFKGMIGGLTSNTSANKIHEKSNSGVQTLAESYWKVFELVYEIENKASKNALD